MSLISWSPKSSRDPFEQMERMLDEVSSGIRSRKENGKSRFMPAVDVYEEKGNVVVEAPLAGVSPDNVEVNIENGILSLKGESKKEHEVDDEDYYRKEVRSGSFFRQISLPASVDEDKVSAEFSDGVLKVTCPKEEKDKGRTVEVEVK